MKKLTITLLSVLALATACQKGGETKENTNQQPATEQSQTNADAETETAAPAEAAKPAVKSYTAVVNDLRLRETPKLDGKVIATLKQGDKMTGTGNVSTEKVTVELRGQKLTDVFYEVTTASGAKGWAFAGAVAEEGTAAADANKEVWVVTKSQVGAINAKTTEADLIKLFGKNNLTQENELYANADVPPSKGVSIFKGKPDEINVFWEEGKKGKKIAFVMITGKKGHWQTPEGIKVGTTLAELEKINGKPISFSGFGWDYGGYVNDFAKGKLEGKLVGLQLNYEGSTMPNDFVGDVTCKSNHPKLAKLANTIYVSSLTSNLE